VAAEADRAYRGFVRGLLRSEHAAHVRRDVGERESGDHVAMKALVVKVLRESGVEPEEVCCTHSVCNSVADIYVRDRGVGGRVRDPARCGAGAAPQGSRAGQEVPGVPRGQGGMGCAEELASAIHLGDLIRLESMLRRELQGKEVKFLVPDVYSKTLRALDDVAS
jgi:hypothetical protein